MSAKIRSFEELLTECTEPQRRFVLGFIERQLLGSDLKRIRIDSMRAAGYAGDNTSLARQAIAILAKPYVRAVIDAWRKSELMGITEMKYRLSGMARASVEDVLDAQGEIIPGMGWLVKAITYRYTKAGVEKRVELHDSKDAIKTMAKIEGALADVLAVKNLPEDPAERFKLLTQEIARTTGRKVVSAVSPEEAN